MKYHLEQKDDIIIYLSTLHINASIESVWALIATTEGYASWFPELEVHHDDDEVHFISDTFESVFQLIEFKNESFISYTWDTATVSFTLQSLDDGVLLMFEENLPTDFENMSRDIAGWHVQLLRLKALAEDKDSFFDNELFNTQKTLFENQLHALTV